MSEQPEANPVSPNGIIVIDKPIGMTSMQVCRIVKRRLINGGAPKKVKVGHGGTLDPLATGVLVVLVGKATRTQDTVMAGTKRYLTEIDLSAFTTTEDAEGERSAVDVQETPTENQIEEVLKQFVGTIQQRPPSFSAMKVNGRRAYKLAREGKPVELKERPVRIDRISLLHYEWPRLAIDVECGKGTYIRSLARDIGVALGTGGYLTGLRRLRVGPYVIDDSIKVDDVPDPLSGGVLVPPVG